MTRSGSVFNLGFAAFLEALASFER